MNSNSMLLAGGRYGDPNNHGGVRRFPSGAACWVQGDMVSALPVTRTIGVGSRRNFDTMQLATSDQSHQLFGTAPENGQGTHRRCLPSAAYPADKALQ